jgi:hypothetical protein
MVASSYPTGLDSLAKPTASTLENAAGFEHDVVHTKEAEAIEAVQSTLGTNPQGSSATVDARLDTLAIDSAVVHKASTETISGFKTFTNTATFTTNPTVNSASSNPYFVSNASDTDAERSAGSLFQRRGVNRWVVAKTSTAESGSDAGSNFAVYRYDDAGDLLGTPFGIIRSTGENRIGETTAGTAHLRLDRSAGNVGIITGTGFPNGVVTAPVGSMYTDTAATNGAIRWIKATGSGNTGWRVEYGDTGWRNIESVLLNGFTATSVKIRRFGDQVSITIFALDGSSSTGTTLYTLPTGFASDSRTRQTWMGRSSSDQTPNSAITYSSNTISLATSPTLITSGRGTIDYLTTDTWPTTLPGTAA